ncbi:MAG: prohibitin family protein, partial [Candidatus Magasanikiibacteriota bacterium]
MENKYKDYIFPGIFLLLGVLSRTGFLILVGLALLYWQLKKNGVNLNTNNFFNKFSLNKKPMETINPMKRKKFGWWILSAVVVILILSFASSFWVVIGAGETGVQTFFGKVRDEEFASGFHLKNPLVKVTKMNVRTQEYTMNVAQGEGKKAEADAITALTKEGLSVDLDITVLYHLVQEKASDVYRDIGLTYDEIVIRPQIRSVIREVIAQYEAKDIYSEKRQEAAQKIFADLQVQLLPRGIEIEDALL